MEFGNKKMENTETLDQSRESVEQAEQVDKDTLEGKLSTEQFDDDGDETSDANNPNDEESTDMKVRDTTAPEAAAGKFSEQVEQPEEVSAQGAKDAENAQELSSKEAIETGEAQFDDSDEMDSYDVTEEDDSAEIVEKTEEPFDDTADSDTETADTKVTNSDTNSTSDITEETFDDSVEYKQTESKSGDAAEQDNVGSDSEDSSTKEEETFDDSVEAEPSEDSADTKEAKADPEQAADKVDEEPFDDSKAAEHSTDSVDDAVAVKAENPDNSTPVESATRKSELSNETHENLGSFEQSKWDNLSQAEKEQAVEKLRDSIAEDLQLENKPNIAYYNNEDPGDYGGYAASNNTIYINRYNMGDAAETADTVAHESRHCWQHERADNPQTEQDYQFKENFEDYVRPEDDFYEYQNQPVEADARDYAQDVKEAIPVSETNPDVAAKPSYEGNGYADNDDAPPSTTGPPELVNKRETVDVSDLPEDFESKTDFLPVSEDVKKSLEGSGLSDEKISEIRNRPKPDYANQETVNFDVHKPDPQTYLNPEYVNKHLEPFEKTGCFRIQKNDPTRPDDIYDGNIGHSSGAFVTSGEGMKKALQESGGDVRKMEVVLGLKENSLGNNPTIISINNPSNLRMPSGNELGATRKEFIPGGFTSGNQPEAVIDSVPKGEYKVTKFNNPDVINWVDKRGEL